MNVIKIGVVGNRQGIGEPIVYRVLDHFILILPEEIAVVIISGGADGVDKFAKHYAKEKGYEFTEYLPEHPLKEFYFKRNRQIAEVTDILIGFIHTGRYRCGTWNTINHFTEIHKHNLFKQFSIFNENGQQWERKQYPLWLLNRVTGRKWELELGEITQ